MQHHRRRSTVTEPIQSLRSPPRKRTSTISKQSTVSARPLTPLNEKVERLNKHKGKIGEALEQALETEKEIDREIIRHRRRIIKRETIKKEREHEKEHQFQRQKSVLSRMNTINLPSVADMNITFDSHGQRLDIHKVNADALSKKDKTYYPVKYTCLDEDTIVERTSIFRQTQQSILQKKIRNKLSNLFLTKKDEISKAKKETSTLNSPQMDLADDDANSEKKEENNEEEEG
eukprot:CAMPEP_0170506084 /NCGR_PEP_ID=MMETSP0208-20121228/53534_1 /TAXON_ID=197538 /ORGANISM="Strombidium inclinatum, Strain S3" /LENGTH=231 /DNA_ID=CAMNT_0010787377 /DNA_START=393 /DNA_END=1084 /DNA_ORIENTATION=-